MKKKQILLGFFFFALVQNISAMGWFTGESNVASQEVQRANQQYQDAQVKEKMRKDTKLELLLRLIEKNKFEIENLRQQFNRNVNDRQNDALLSDYGQRITNIENANFQEQLQNLNKKIEEQERDLSEFRVDHGKYAAAFARHGELPGKVETLEKGLVELNQNLNNMNSEKEKRDSEIKALNEAVNKLSKKIKTQKLQMRTQNLHLEKLDHELETLIGSLTRDLLYRKSVDPASPDID